MTNKELFAEVQKTNRELFAEIQRLSVELGRVTFAKELAEERARELAVALSEAREELSASARACVKATSKPEDVRQLLVALRDRQKIDAIKRIRELTGMALKESKDMVEQAFGL